LVQHHKYSINDIENLIPFELEIYLALLNDYIKKIEEEQKRNKNGY